VIDDSKIAEAEGQFQATQRREQAANEARQQYEAEGRAIREKTVGCARSGLLKRRRMRRNELAHEAGVDRTYVSQVERQKRNLTISVLARLAAALKVAPAELLTPPPRTKTRNGRTDQPMCGGALPSEAMVRRKEERATATEHGDRADLAGSILRREHDGDNALGDSWIGRIWRRLAEGVIKVVDFKKHSMTIHIE
jgi:transcriptional regulator with XRE-family HTH domain